MVDHSALIASYIERAQVVAKDEICNIHKCDAGLYFILFTSAIYCVFSCLAAVFGLVCAVRYLWKTRMMNLALKWLASVVFFANSMVLILPVFAISRLGYAVRFLWKEMKINLALKGLLVSAAVFVTSIMLHQTFF